MSSKKETEINGFNTIRKANINVKQLKGLFAAEPSPPPVKPAPKGARSPKSPAPVQNQSNIRSFAVGKTEIRIEETKTPSSTPKSQGPKTPTTPKAPPETKTTSNIPKQSIEEEDDHSKSVQDKIAKFRALQQDANSVRQMQRVPSRQTSSSSSTAASPSPLSNVKVNSWDDDSYQPPVVITDNNYGASQTYNGGVTESQEDHGLARSQEEEKDRYEESPIQENGNHVSHLEENYSNDQETHSNGHETYSNGQEDYYQQVTNHDNEDDYQGQQTYGSSNYEEERREELAEERREELAEERREELAEEIVSHVQNDDDGGSATYQYQDNSHEYSEINNLEDDGQYQEQQHQEHFNSEQEQEEQRDEIQEEHPIISHLEHEEHNNNEIEENSSEINSYAEHEVAENHENESPQYE